MAAAQFVDVFNEETSKMKENAVALIITCLVSNYTKTIILHRLSEYCQIIPIIRQYSLRLRGIIVKYLPSIESYFFIVHQRAISTKQAELKILGSFNF